MVSTPFFYNGAGLALKAILFRKINRYINLSMFPSYCGKQYYLGRYGVPWLAHGHYIVPYN
ncbi:hypothetical protein SDC9_91832 [bioreactor metagenome]|uniref:Uncharacterized protein n=1 Tax=bioreactor metagenome TaxID=1076179 RepID=A0A644ZWQ4_9ZZZZ